MRSPPRSRSPCVLFHQLQQQPRAGFVTSLALIAGGILSLLLAMLTQPMQPLGTGWLEPGQWIAAASVAHWRRAAHVPTTGACLMPSKNMLPKGERRKSVKAEYRVQRTLAQERAAALRESGEATDKVAVPALALHSQPDGTTPREVALGAQPVAGHLRPRERQDAARVRHAVHAPLCLALRRRAGAPRHSGPRRPRARGRRAHLHRRGRRKECETATPTSPKPSPTSAARAPCCSSKTARSPSTPNPARPARSSKAAS